MKFTDVDVTGFGVWSGLALEALSPQLTVVYGPNEAGKTTILECLRGVLYGFSPGRRDRYLPPVQGDAGGGSIGLCIDRQSHLVSRLDDGSRLLGGVTVTGPDGSMQGESRLRDLLGGVDEAAYSNIFSVGLRELQELATLNDSDAAAWLYDLSTGLEGVSISDSLRELRASRVRLVSPIGDKSQVIDLLSQRDGLRAEIEELGTLHDRYWQLSDEKAATDEGICTAEKSLAAITAELQLFDAALAIRNPWRERKLVEEKLGAFGGLADFPPDALRRLERLLAGLRKARSRRTRIKRRWRAIRAKRRGIKVNERLWRQAARVAALAEHEHWIATLDEQLRAAEQNVAELERQLAAARAKCGLPEAIATTSEVLSETAAAELRGPAKQLRAARKRLKQARGESQSLRETRDARREEIATALAGRGEVNLAAALETQGQLVAQYRRRLQLDDRLDQMAMHREELEERHRKLVDGQVLPLWLLIAIAVVFVLGGGLVLAGLIIPWGMGTAALGGLIAAGAAAGKFGWQRSAANRLEATEKQLKMLKRQLEQAKSERSELDELLPSGGGALTSRLQAAEAQLASLEELLSTDARRQAADSEAVAAKARLKDVAWEWNQARRQWQEALGEAGLPIDLLPPQVKHIFAHAGSLLPLERRLQQARDERDRWRREQAAVAARIEQLGADAGWQKPDPGTPAVPLVEQLRRLRREVAAEDELVERRNALDERLARLRRFGLKCSRKARLFARRRRELYRAAGALDENDFRRRAEARAELDELLRRRGALSQQIVAALHGLSSEQNAAVLLGLPAGELEQQHQELVARRQSAADDIKRLSEQRGAIAHEQTLLAEDRRLAHKQVELDVVEQRLAEAVARWQTLALTEHLIETVKEDYERNRQPEVLQEASRYLERMTEGRYRRVWTPLGEQTLRVDDEEGRPLAVELLSTGAREQLFLSLRLALVSRFAGLGKAMPLVLDDVLVNFDQQRAAGAAAVFVEFAAAGHQLLVFTCHEHIAHLFRQLHCDVRRLPANVDASRKIVGPSIVEPSAVVEPPRRRREKRPKEPTTSEPQIIGDESPAADNSHSNGESVGPATSVAAEPIAPAATANDLEPDIPPVRRHRADPPHEVTPARARRSSWSAEEFEGELEDQVRREIVMTNDQ